MLRLYVILACQDVGKQWIVVWRDTVVIQKHLMNFSLLFDVQFRDGQGVLMPLLLLQQVLIHLASCKRHFSSFPPPFLLYKVFSLYNTFFCYRIYISQTILHHFIYTFILKQIYITIRGAL